MEIDDHLAALDPPTFKPKDVRRVQERLDDLMRGWDEDDGDEDEVEKRLERLFEAAAALPESPERAHIGEHLIELAELMGLEVDADD